MSETTATSLPAGRPRLDVSAIYDRPRTGTGRGPLPYAPSPVSFAVQRPTAPLLPATGTGPVRTVSIVDLMGDGPRPALVLAPVSGRWPVVASAATVAVVLVAAGAATQLVPAGFTGPQAAASPSARPAVTGARPVPTRTAASRPTPSLSPTAPSEPASVAPSATRPMVPADALVMTGPAASGELELQSRDGAATVAGLAGSWVPQVSFKCPGLRVDLGPGWVPDGLDDTPSVSIQQILALHLALGQRLGALTVHPTQLGMPADQGTAGACARQTIWMSVVPQRFTSAQGAKDWCDANALPVRECSARYVARPGERSTQVDRH